MNKIRENIFAKVIAFIVIILCAIVIVLSTIIVGVNVNYEWYYKDDATVQEEIYEDIASYANVELAGRIYSYETFSKGTAVPHFYIPFDDELISHEGNAKNFGYKIASNTSKVIFVNKDKESKIRIVNNELAKSIGVHKYSFNHQDIKLDIFLGKISQDTIPGMLYQRYIVLNNIYEYGKVAIAVGVMCLLVAICLFIFLIITVGKKNDNSFIRRVPIEVIVAAVVALMLLTIAVNETICNFENICLLMALIIIDTTVVATVALGFVLAIVLKIKYNSLIKGSLIYIVAVKLLRFIKWIVNKVNFIFKNVPLVWKTVVVLMVGIIINGFIVLYANSNMYYSGLVMFIWFLGAVITMGAGIYIALCFRKLKVAARHLADGELNYQTDKKGLFLDLAQHADDLNSIREGIFKAVEEKMKSERFKTELITNVSHDIKTPLTSIINYVDFLKKEEIENDKAREYIDVLDRQSARLKKLIEDLVEASKAATGAMKLNMEKCQIDVLMMQVTGEYKEKTEAENLNVVSRISDEKLEILADGRSLWRVFDNLMNNICKYAQPGTRVYQTLEKIGDKVVITYKNTSKYELNITEDELMERFVRGDKSRNTEGSGLGLSIAKNLIELQGGNFRVHIDGDLFKVTIEFNLYN